MIYSQKQVLEINQTLCLISSEYADILLKYTQKNWLDARIYEFAVHGFSRRLKILRACIFNAFEICPLQNTSKLEDDSIENLTINLHAFYINLYGALENLAWVWTLNFYIKDKDNSVINFSEIGFSKKYKKFRLTCSIKILEKLAEYENWYSGLENFRHALAHRIPLYVPPVGRTPNERDKYNALIQKQNNYFEKMDLDGVAKTQEEIDDIGKFIPKMKHSWLEKSDEIKFHEQILRDWKVICELAILFYNEIDNIQ